MQALTDLLQKLSGMQWADYLDIAIVAFLIYKLIPFLKTPSIQRISRAVIALLVISFLTEALELHTINFLLNQCLSIGLLALVILFQPELRRILDRLGSVDFIKFFGTSKPEQEMDLVIGQAVMACEIMSRERVGALIVFERKNRLDEYFKTGTVIDGELSEQLIRNIFFVKAPLHDGAVIVRGGRVAAAGCVLPLSDSSYISADLGTRHRAGVGMSEASDAVVVIVSEETGAISVAIGGTLKRHLAPQTLDKLLRNELLPEEAQDGEASLSRRLKQRITGKDGREG